MGQVVVERQLQDPALLAREAGQLVGDHQAVDDALRLVRPGGECGLVDAPGHPADRVGDSVLARGRANLVDDLTAGDAEQPAQQRSPRASKPARPTHAATNVACVASSASAELARLRTARWNTAGPKRS